MIGTSSTSGTQDALAQLEHAPEVGVKYTQGRQFFYCYINGVLVERLNRRALAEMMHAALSNGGTIGAGR